jgi:hypothetical protein
MLKIGAALLLTFAFCSFFAGPDHFEALPRTRPPLTNIGSQVRGVPSRRTALKPLWAAGFSCPKKPQKKPNFGLPPAQTWGRFNASEEADT